jgi:signal transduction histidine kinase
VHVHLRALRHQIQEATFLSTDLLSLGRLEADTLHFERARVDLGQLLTEAADESPARNRVLLNLPKEPLAVIGDADRLRHAFATLIDRAVELSPQEDVTVLARVSAEEAAVEINCRTRELTEDDVELPRLLVEGSGGRLLLITRGAIRGFAGGDSPPTRSRPAQTSQRRGSARHAGGLTRNQPPSDRSEPDAARRG